MGEKELKIFKLCNELHKLLGDKEAIADLKKLHSNHPEMIIKNPRPKSERDYIAIKHLDKDKDKIGDIGVRNDDGTNIIFHTNISANRNFKRLAKKEVVVAGEAVHSLHTSRPAELGGNNQRLSGADAHSATIDNTIPQTPKESQVTTNTLMKEMLKMQESISSIPRVKEIHKNFQKDLEKSFNIKNENLKDEKTLKTKLIY
ncbi:hypothetical protein [Campylobacter upsaliensis]|uniref:hypothetical protein n=1 Tax=Campylobacter upsaliensis TaxID=28080 RepID=UPI002149C345|nr:hypothetical protein [Campylobacter upsaliensis]MCR2099147.1 hypothetical protein [Campylobacter upsaliensis]